MGRSTKLLIAELPPVAFPDGCTQEGWSPLNARELESDVDLSPITERKQMIHVEPMVLEALIYLHKDLKGTIADWERDERLEWKYAGMVYPMDEEDKAGEIERRRDNTERKAHLDRRFALVTELLKCYETLLPKTMSRSAE